MLGTGIDDATLRRAESHAQESQGNHDSQGRHDGVEEIHRHESSDSSSGTNPVREGTWGERNVEDVSETEAMHEYETLRHELTQLHKTRTTESQGGKSIAPTKSRRSWAAATRTKSRTEKTPAWDNDLEAGGEAEETEDEFELGEFMRAGHFEKRTDEAGSMKKVGVVFENLTVKGVGSTATFVRTVPDAILGSFGPDLYRIMSRFVPFLRSSSTPTRTLIHDFTGCVRDGEIMLVLGRPGSGCSTFLKAVTNNRETFAAVEGDVSYGGIPADKQKKLYRGEVVYNDEDDIHFATLSVWKTLTFALMNKSKKAAKGDIPVIANALLKMFGISHTKHTQVGDDFVRGVSGGERKRVSIAETLASKATVIAWDNSTRGLDASTALDYARSLRIMTDVSNRTTLVTLYQAGEGIYETMDKVMVIDQGRQIFCGPANRAKQYFIDLGFECPDRQTTADFLTAVTDPIERRFRPGFEKSAPRTAEDFEKAFRNSADYQELLEDVAQYKKSLHDSDYTSAKQFENAVRESKSKHVSDKSPYTIPFFKQVIICTKREAWLLLSDKTALWTKLFIVISCGLIVGSLFHGQPSTTESTFTRGGTVFFSIIFLGWLQMTELMRAVSGRAIVSRHNDYAFYRPSAVALARVILDFPVIAVQVLIFGVIMYWLTGLAANAGQFWIYMLFVYTTTFITTALYRMFASMSPEIDTAVRFSGVALNILLIYTGYVIPKTQLLRDRIWFGWLYWVNPFSYSFEAALSNEIAPRIMQCSPSQLVPQGPGVLPEFQGCAISGAAVNAHEVTGSDFLDSAYSYNRSNLWRNWGVVLAFGVLYIIVTMIATRIVDFAQGGGGALVFKKSRKTKKQAQKSAAPLDEESSPVGGSNGSGTSSTIVSDGTSAQVDSPEKELGQLTASRSIFTWRDLEYTVPYLDGERKLLNKVNGYAKPGVMVALMGASGAGKTTLLNTLAQRQTMGVVRGDMLVDGHTIGADFRRSTGFCLQGDLHDGTQTVREALEFSAILRQDASVPRSEKMAYVDKIIDLLELNDLEDAIIMSLGVEQRKRLTIGVELAAKPSLLLFLDEPTSGLDSQSAYSIIRFLKKLSRAGQAIICTIHQPSSVLIEQFDMVLALNPGGNTFYFGPMGEGGKDVVKYFADRGAVCPPNKNVAEFLLETAARPHKKPDGTKIDWNREWEQSEEAQRVIEEIDSLTQTRSRATQPPETMAITEFAAPTLLQSVELTKRMFKQYWRDPSYVYGKLFGAVIVGIFNGFTFWKLGYTVQDMQNRMFTCFLIVTIPPTVVNAVVPKFYSNLAIWEARELPSRIYGWVAFCTANVIVEIPAAVVSSVLYFVLWYWPTGLPTESSVSGYVFLMILLIFLFTNSWGQWIAAFAPNFTVISNVLPFFFVMFGLFNGMVRPYTSLPVFWKYWMYWVNPSTYWMGGILGATLDGIPVRCAPHETAVFDAPPSQTCQDYAGVFADMSGGFLVNPDATSGCEYCPISSGNQYLATLNIETSQKWRNFGIFLAFCVSNWMLVYFFVYTVRIRGWSFGFGYIFGGLGKLVDCIKKPFKRKERQ
ncbi:Brefeldin A resistance protein-like protein [Hapsidospora chrysogenum ATCC 11550]|uniref:Brefeldin A resistance protein-like protein n=1 Tax=Hapsidospora chrysogenum (strain ATCC 11550 / CBS 779.69 / DSM 880 / IAM 14645 / JCM 23072 / IMI 49137) TaxID=857340 RepID=A0A086T9Y1_HAPC1|nr:Brefeldin A resistance protein-like protein [Hapsidospora chrysogenum ATCC 11550]